MKPQNARIELGNVRSRAADIRKQLADDLDVVAKSTAWSDSYKAERSKNLRATAAAELATLRNRAQVAADALAAYRPTVATDPAAVSRAAARVTQLLDSGQSLTDVLRLAATSKDGALIEAVREAAPTLVDIEARKNGTQESAADRLAEIGAAADRAAARALAGTPAGADARDAILGRATVGLATHEISGALAAAEGRHVNPMTQAVAGHYAQQQYDATAAGLDA